MRGLQFAVYFVNIQPINLLELNVSVSHNKGSGCWGFSKEWASAAPILMRNKKKQPLKYQTVLNKPILFVM